MAAKDVITKETKRHGRVNLFKKINEIQKNTNMTAEQALLVSWLDILARFSKNYWLKLLSR